MSYEMKGVYRIHRLHPEGLRSRGNVVTTCTCAVCIRRDVDRVEFDEIHASGSAFDPPSSIERQKRTLRPHRVSPRRNKGHDSGWNRRAQSYSSGDTAWMCCKSCLFFCDHDESTSRTEGEKCQAVTWSPHFSVFQSTKIALKRPSLAF